jgi:hypothetical protein
MKNKPYGYIYLIIDHYYNKVYVGQKTGIFEKTTNYYGSGKLIIKIIKERKIHLEKILLGYCYSKTKLDKAEIECIDFYNSTDKLYGYNLAKGGHNGKHHALTKKQISEKLKGFKHSPETRQKMSNSHKGKPSQSKGIKWTVEQKNKLIKSMTGYKNPKYVNVNIENIYKDYLNNLNVLELSKKYQCSWQTICRRLETKGVTFIKGNFFK